MEGEAQEEPQGVSDHAAAMSIVIAAMQLLDCLDLARTIEAADRALAFGCFRDPTLWIEKHGDLEHDKRVLEAALPLWRAAKALREGREVPR